MEDSTGVREALTRYYVAFSGGDPQAFDACLASDDRTFVTGTQRVGADRASWEAEFRALVESGMGIRIEGSDAPRCYAEGDVGWAADDVTWHMPGGLDLVMRMSAVLRRENGDWRFVHQHNSFAVPDELAMEQAGAWREQLSL